MSQSVLYFISSSYHYFFINVLLAPQSTPCSTHTLPDGSHVGIKDGNSSHFNWHEGGSVTITPNLGARTQPGSHPTKPPSKNK